MPIVNVYNGRSDEFDSGHKNSEPKESQHPHGLKIATSQLTRLHFVNSTVNRDSVNLSL